MKTLLLFICLLYDLPKQAFQKTTLFNGRFSYSVPLGMKAFDPRMANDDYKYIKYYLNKDSSLRIEIYLYYEQVNQLQMFQKHEQDILLHRIDGADERIISSEMKVVRNRKVMLISCEYLLPGMYLDKGLAQRVVFNTSAGLVGINMMHSYKTSSERAGVQRLFSQLNEKLEIH